MWFLFLFVEVLFPNPCGIRRMKALLFVLIRAFEFRLAVPAEHISKRSMIIQRPVVMGDPKGVNRMPLILTPV